MSFRIADYKKTAMQHIVGCGELVEMLGGAAGDPAELIWEKVFPFIRVPQTQEEVGRFLLVEVNIPQVNRERTDLLAGMEFVVVVLCHKDAMRTEHGATACDYMSGLVMRLFNRNRAFSGGRLRLASDEASVLTGGSYHYRTLTFTTLEHNGECGV